MKTPPTIDVLAEETLLALLAANPFGATVLGVHDFDHEVPDVSRAYEEQRRARLADLEERVLACEGLEGEDAITRETLVFALRTERDEIDSELVEIAVSPFGTHMQVLHMVPKASLAEPGHAEAYLERCNRLDRFLTQAAQRHREGVARGRAPTARGVARSIEQIGRYLDTPLEQDPLLAPDPPPGWAQAGEWRQRLLDALDRVVRPAMAAYRQVLTEILPDARPDERSGLAWLPDGEEVYARAVRQHTTTDPGVEDIHRLGLDIVEELGEEYRELAREALDTSDLPRIFERLRNDPALRFETRDEVRQAAQRALDRAQEAVPACFGRLPRTGCSVRDIPEVEAPEAPIAYYVPPADDGSREGVYWVNTHQPETRTRFESEALAFHESVPGHHLQTTIAHELDLPRFRRLMLFTAYVEGWGLYAERLADEMGLYSCDLTRLGMLSMDSLRAGRLVVDTGMHAKGWSRQRAVDFLRENSPQALNNIDNEVDRYIAWPGQALAYMIGRLEIQRLRERARDRLGARFDVPGFHDTVLLHGALPLGVLEGVVEAWNGRV